MAFPSGGIEKVILEEIEAADGEAKSSELYHKVASHFPQLTQADLEATYPESQVRIWDKRVQGAKQSLVSKGEIDASTYGIWKITEKGRVRLGLGLKPSPPPPRLLSLPTISMLLDRERQQICAQLHELLMNLHPQQFEALAAALLESLGFTDVEVTKYVGDGGIDGYGNFEMGVVKVRAAFQVKRWRNNVPPADINQFRGAILGEFDQGIFITTSDFSDEAKRVSSRRGVVPIVLINGDRILNIMLEKGLGVRQEPLTVAKIDDEFFTAFGTTEE